MDTDIENELKHPHLITVIILVVSVVVGFAIIFTLRHSYAATKIVVKGSDSKSSAPQSVSTSDANQYLAKFYKEYSAAAAKSESLTVKKQIVAKYGTYQVPQYYTPPKGYHYDKDPIFCTQSIPARIEISSKSSGPETADATIAESTNGGPVQVGAAVTKQSSGALKISKIQCSFQLTAQPD